MRDLKTANDNGKVRWKTDMTKAQLQQAQAFDLGTTTSAGTSIMRRSTTTPGTMSSRPPRQ
jgi:hypothetical protein